MENVSARVALRTDLEDRLDLDGRPARQRGHADGAADADARVLAEHVGQQFAAAVDHGRLAFELRRAGDQAEDFHHADDPIETAELGAKGGENAEPGQACGRETGLLVALRPDATGRDLAFDRDGQMPGRVGQVVDNKQRPIETFGFGSGGKLQVQLGQFRFGDHVGHLFASCVLVC